jgi:hypothetical protein
MADTTIKKVEAGSSPRGEMGQKYLVAGKRVSMRLWIDEPGGKLKAPTTRDYENGRIRNLRERKARPRRPDAESKSRRLLVSTGRSRTVYGYRSNCPASRIPRSRHGLKPPLDDRHSEVTQPYASLSTLGKDVPVLP